MPQRFARVLLVGFCVMILTQETGLGSLLFGAECIEACEEDFSPGHCPLACTACPCAHGSVLGAAGLRNAPSPLPVGRIDAEVGTVDGELRPDLIDHIPKTTTP